jgi:two-component sensor histidine kinase
MFRKLKFRILWTNLIILTVLIALSFFSTYAITYKMIYGGIEKDLFRVSDFKHNADVQPNKPPLGQPPLERMAIFELITSLEGEIVKVDAFFDAEEIFFENLLSLTKKEAADRGIVSFEGNDWAFIYKQNLNERRYSFIDVSPQMTVLDNLIFVFSGVFLACVFLVILISNYLTTTATKPIKVAFDKQKQFISDASHELKTPIAIISSTTDLLLAEEKSVVKTDQESRKWLENIKLESKKMGRLTKDLLYLAQVDYQEGIKAVYQNFNFSNNVEEIALTMEVLAYERSLAFTYEIEPDVMISGNPEQLNEVVRILFDNAIKYTNKDGNIQLTLKKHGSTCSLSIENTGIGIDHEHLPQIFDRFYRVDSVRTRDAQSHGLGLSIAKSIVEQHKGKITCLSTPGISTIFVVKL